MLFEDYGISPEHTGKDLLDFPDQKLHEKYHI